eukprot:SAG31_NODE_13149_length_889_cov_6.678481_1_plen_67_part_00
MIQARVRRGGAAAACGGRVEYRLGYSNGARGYGKGRDLPSSARGGAAAPAPAAADLNLFSEGGTIE